MVNQLSVRRPSADEITIASPCIVGTQQLMSGVNRLIPRGAGDGALKASATHNDGNGKTGPAESPGDTRKQICRGLSSA